MTSTLGMVISTFALVFISTVLLPSFKADRFSGLCPPSYPRRVSYNGTGYCYEVGSQGPCGRMSVIASDPLRPNFGICRCKDYGSHHCFGRPLLWSPKYERCYFEFSQGPCRKGQWLVKNKSGSPECQKTPCPIIENQRTLLRSEYPENDFYFTTRQSNMKCLKTGSQGFCKSGERIYFLGSDPIPRCLTYDPYNCNAFLQSTASGGSSHNSEDVVNNSPVAFGVPWDGI